MVMMAIFAFVVIIMICGGCIARTAGNGCQIQEVVDMGIFNSHSAYLRATFSVRSRGLVPFLL